MGYEVTNTQVGNHLRKWKIRYQRIEKLRILSGALWDDEQKMIVLEEQHYLGHTLVCTFILKSYICPQYPCLLLKHLCYGAETCHLMLNCLYLCTETCLNPVFYC